MSGLSYNFVKRKKNDIILLLLKFFYLSLKLKNEFEPYQKYENRFLRKFYLVFVT